MKTVQEIADMLDEARRRPIKLTEEGELLIPICLIGNGYQYGNKRPDKAKIKEIDRKLFFEIVNNPDIKIIDCVECWGCGDW